MLRPRYEYDGFSSKCWTATFDPARYWPWAVESQCNLLWCHNDPDNQAEGWCSGVVWALLHYIGACSSLARACQRIWLELADCLNNRRSTECGRLLSSSVWIWTNPFTGLFFRHLLFGRSSIRPPVGGGNIWREGELREPVRVFMHTTFGS